MANRPELDLLPVGDIYSLTDLNLKIMQSYWKLKGITDIDLVCGGPPCQGYSGIGHRRTFKLAKEEIPSNHLFQEMVRVIATIRPKIFLFENVKGLLVGRWTPDGKKGEIFEDVVEAFDALEGYSVQWDLLHAKDYGVPQNRPRVLLVGIRNDVLPKGLEAPLAAVSAKIPEAKELNYLPTGKGGAPNLVNLLSDLEDPQYLKKGESTKYTKEPKTDIQKHLRTMPDGNIMAKGHTLTEQEYSKHADYIREKFAHMIANDGEIPAEFKTKKFAQRVFPKDWGKDGPNITATSLPEDFVHYKQPRSPTVREWARIQTFPDWYKFKGPRTTGGRRRAGDPSKGLWDRDVPRYTQIGNAVPVLMAKAIGQHFVKILRGEL
jgi:DNA (cytosine-5)-methyltransferase 1